MIDCRQCKWRKGEWHGREFDKCLHPTSGSKYCDDSRNRQCGADAKLFEPKPPKFYTILGRKLKQKLTPAQLKKPEFDFTKQTPEIFSWMTD